MDEENQLKDTDDEVPLENAIAMATSYNKTESLVDITNHSFKELCKTLEYEQNKLQELEQRRKTLQEQMQLLKKEIEDEKESYRLNLDDSSTDNPNSCEIGESIIERQEEAIQKTGLEHESTATIETMNGVDEEFIESNSLGPSDES